MLQIDKAFNPETLNVHGFYQKPGVGLYIPLYQREYSWDKDNIEQLLDDVSQGIMSITENKDEIRFLGTVISVKVNDSRSIYPIDPAGLPSLIVNIIDGQQRLSTIALFSTLLYHHIKELQKTINASDNQAVKDAVREACDDWYEKIIDVFSLNLRGKPKRKPKIIRGDKDQWTKDGELHASYKSDVANYLAQFIEYIDDSCKADTLPVFGKTSRTGRNLKRINEWIKKTVLQAHIKEDDEFITAVDILNGINQDNIWQYERKDLEDVVRTKDYSSSKTMSYQLSSLVQLFAVAHYLLERCCFTIIQPMNEDWAFDMFQSLNATGTPLTAIETFKPNVVNYVAKHSERGYKGSKAEESIEKVDALFEDTKSANRKSSLTKEFLTSFALTVEGKKLNSHFSQQRKWLTETYNNVCQTDEEKQAFINFFGDYASFYKNVWLDYKGDDGSVIPMLKGHPEAELASLLLRYLKESNHKMSIIILGRLYADILRDRPQAVDKFVTATKLVARFYTQWRSSHSNAGLDVQYRTFIKRPEGKDGKTELANSWRDHPVLNVDLLADYFQEVLLEKDIVNKTSWKERALLRLRYDKARSVCKLALFISAHDTITDLDHIGLMKAGKVGVSPYLTAKQWDSEDLKSIEHVAPRNGTREWDESLYTKDEWYQSIGNLTLLPTEINSSVSNKGWKSKYFYYKYLSESDLDDQTALKTTAEHHGVELSPKTLELLQSSSYKRHIEPLVQLGVDGTWDQAFVEKRAGRILDLVWEWLGDE